MPNSRVVTLRNGNRVEISLDPNHRIPTNIFRQMEQRDIDQVLNSRSNPNRSSGGINRDVNQVHRDDFSIPSRIDTIPLSIPQRDRNVQVSETQRSMDGYTIMGGRN